MLSCSLLFSQFPFLSHHLPFLPCLCSWQSRFSIAWIFYRLLKIKISSLPTKMEVKSCCIDKCCFLHLARTRRSFLNRRLDGQQRFLFQIFLAHPYPTNFFGKDSKSMYVHMYVKSSSFSFLGLFIILVQSSSLIIC